LKRLKDALAGADVGAVRQAHEGLLTASQEFAQRLYQSAQAQQQAASGGGGGGDAGGTPSDDDVADAEIVDDERSA
jgi:molecular chaperone DnaK